MPEMFVAIMDLADALGVRRINELPGCWEMRIDDAWRFSLNGHDDARQDSSAGVAVPPFTLFVEFNGFPAGLVTPHGGQFAAGEAANEDEFIRVIRERAEAVRAGKAAP